MFLLVNTFHRIPGDTAGHIVSKHRIERRAFERKGRECRKPRCRPGSIGPWLVVIDLEGEPCPRGRWAPANTGKIVEWEGQ